MVGLVGPGHRSGIDPEPTRRRLSRYAAAISDHTSIRAEVINDVAQETQDLAGDLNRHRDVDAVVTLHGALSPSLPAGPAGGVNVPVLSDHDALTITLTAAVLTTLSRSQRPTACGRIVVAGADALPNLTPLLVAADAGDVTMWRRSDRQAFPLPVVTAEADVVVNLLDDDHELAALAERYGLAAITPDLLNDPLLVLPALVGVMLADPAVHLDSASDFGLYCKVVNACTMALVLATPPDRTYPISPTRDLTERLMAAMRAASCEP